MDIKISVQRRHLLYLIISLSILTGINYSIAQSGSAPNPGHSADQIGPGTIADTLTVSQGSVDVAGDLDVSGELDVSGGIKAWGILQIGSSSPTTYEVSNKRYVVEAGPAQAGRVVPIDSSITDELCRDKDGCLITLIKYGEPSYTGQDQIQIQLGMMFISEESRLWRISDVSSEQYSNWVDNDRADGYWEYSNNCIFTDAETYDGNNAFSDNREGFGLLNKEGGYYDNKRFCRVIFRD